MKIIKRESGSITLFVLIAMLFFAMFLVGMYILNANAEASGTAETARIKEIYEEGVNNIDDVYETNKNELLTKAAKPGDYVKYIVPEKEFTITTDQTGYNVAQTFKTSDYMGLWQILYNDKEHGLQIISADDVTNGVKLYLGNTSDLAKAKSGYNKSVATLNNFCSNYVNETYAISGRCVGSNPSNPEGETQVYTSTTYSYALPHVKNMIKEDMYYEEDCNAMISAINQNVNGIINIGKQYWLASRGFATTSSKSNLCVRYVHANSNSTNGNTLVYINSAGDTTAYAPNNCIRVIIILKNSLRTNIGDGSMESPFELNV